MRFELPEDTAEFAAVVHKRGVSLRDANHETVYDALDALGVLDLLGPETADARHAELNTVVALEALASAGVSGPVAETIWARATSEAARETTGFVGVPTGLTARGSRLVPYGLRCGHLLAGTDVIAVRAAEPADIKVHADAGHAWVATEGESFERRAPGYLWRSQAALTVGYLETALTRAVEHAKTRHQFGRPLSSYQALQFRLAECRWRLSGLQLLVREAAWRADRGDSRSLAVSALAWLYARRVGRAATAHVHQVFGAIGFTRELGLVDLTGPAAFLRMAVPPKQAAQTVWTQRAAVGASPPSTVLAGFKS